MTLWMMKELTRARNNMFKPERDKLLKKIQTKVILRQKGVSTDCTHCGFDPVTHESSDPACAYCAGTGKIYGNDKITVIDANIRMLSGESSLRRDLGNISHSASLLYCDFKYRAKIKLAYQVTVGEVNYKPYTDSDGKLVIRELRDPDGKVGRIETTLERLQ